MLRGKAKEQMEANRKKAQAYKLVEEQRREARQQRMFSIALEVQMLMFILTHTNYTSFTKPLSYTNRQRLEVLVDQIAHGSPLHIKSKAFVEADNVKTARISKLALIEPSSRLKKFKTMSNASLLGPLHMACTYASL